MKELLGLLKEVNRIFRDDHDIAVRTSKPFLTKLKGVSLRSEANRRRLDALRQ